MGAGGGKESINIGGGTQRDGVVLLGSGVAAVTRNFDELKDLRKMAVLEETNKLDLHGKAAKDKEKEVTKVVNEALSSAAEYDNIDKLVEDTAKLADRAAMSKEVNKYLDTISKFHNYSFYNQVLIMLQDPNATRVAGFRQWQKHFDRHVTKEAKGQGIKICCPVFAKTCTNAREVKEKGEEPEYEKCLVKFNYRGTVFDVRFTEGKTLPTVDYKGGSGDDKGLLSDLAVLSKKEGINVRYTHNREELGDDDTNGCHRIESTTSGSLVFGTKKADKAIEEEKNLKRSILVRDQYANGKKVPKGDQANVLVHELAHDYLHKYSDNTRRLPKKVKEVEAEAVSVVVAKHFGIKTKGEKYLAVWAGVKNTPGMAIRERMNRVSKCAKWILNSVEETRTGKAAPSIEAA